MVSSDLVEKIDSLELVGQTCPRVNENARCGIEGKNQQIGKVKQNEAFRTNINAMFEKTFKHAEESHRLREGKRKRSEVDEHDLDENPTKKINTSTNVKNSQKSVSNYKNHLKTVQQRGKLESINVTSKNVTEVINATTVSSSKAAASRKKKTLKENANIKKHTNNNVLDEILAGFDCPILRKSTRTFVREKEREEEQLRRRKTICHVPEFSTELFPECPVKVYSPLEHRDMVVGYKHGREQTLGDCYIKFGRYLSKFTRKYL